jgi:S-adenosylmethionine hydrolase
MPPVIALVTDFGLQDAYVGAMKGAILRAAPEATLVDVVHSPSPLTRAGVPVAPDMLRSRLR